MSSNQETHEFTVKNECEKLHKSVQTASEIEATTFKFTCDFSGNDVGTQCNSCTVPPSISEKVNTSCGPITPLDICRGFHGYQSIKTSYCESGKVDAMDLPLDIKEEPVWPDEQSKTSLDGTDFTENVEIKQEISVMRLPKVEEEEISSYGTEKCTPEVLTDAESTGCNSKESILNKQQGFTKQYFFKSYDLNGLSGFESSFWMSGNGYGTKESHRNGCK
ncbi:uncharacterized protein [Anabrus simplex]|uniref:uncharacterized protein n=1 Tax=Anabrus simplex TaxID=316456 RepID=UPI0034DD32F4